MLSQHRNNTIRKQLCQLIIIALTFISLGSWARAADVLKEEYPNKQITMIVAYAAGGKMDLEARALAVQLKKYLGVDVKIENVIGAGGRIGLTKLYRSKPDGYTIGGITIPTIMLVEEMYKADYRSNNFTKIFAWGVYKPLLAVNIDGWNTFEDFARAARAKTLSCGISGVGGGAHLAGLILEAALGAKFNWVPFNNGAEAAASLAGKHIDAITSSAATVLPLQRAKKLKTLVVLAQKRDMDMPEVPTIEEFGYNNYVSVPSINGVAAPPGLDPARKKILEDAFAKAAKENEFIAWAQRSGTEIETMSSQEFTKRTAEMAIETVKYIHALGK